MKRLFVFVLVLTLLVITGTLVSADGQTRLKESKNTSNQFAVNNLDKLYRT